MKEKNPGFKTRYYLDWAASAKPDEIYGKEALTSQDTIYANPSSSHEEGRLAKKALESARMRCAKILGVEPEKLYFTSGGTESNALVLHSLLLKKGKGRLLSSAVEHPSVRENCLMLKKMGLETGVIGVEKDGRITLNTFSKALQKYGDARFAAVMGVNNETGALMDLKALLSVVRNTRQEKNLPPIHFHCDLVQAVGKVPLEIGELDSASISAHKLGGPRGIGLLYLNKPLESIYSGGGQEGGVRPGTENTHGALALAGVLELRASPETVRAEEEKARERWKYLIGNLKKIKRCFLIPQDREAEDSRFSPWIVQAGFKGVPGAVMVRALDEEGISVSTGSACSSGSPQRPVLEAMGLDEASRLEGIRISQGWSTEKRDLDALLSGIEKALSFL
jgi:cysteine desulfurase